MKKLVIMAVLAVVAFAASSAEVGVRDTHNPKDLGDSFGVTLGQKFGDYGVEGDFDRTTRGLANVNKFSLVGSYDVAKVVGITIAPKFGVSIIDSSVAGHGFTTTVGVGASYPLMKNVSLVADYGYQRGQDRVREFNGNQVSAGVKYSF